MQQVAYHRAASEGAALALAAAHPGAAFIAGGTDLLQLFKQGPAAPAQLIDISRLPLDRIEPRSDASADAIRIGALARLADVARHPEVRRGWPALAQAIEASASPQVRNLATVGGNLLQRTRCGYFRSPDLPCNKRQPGSGCAARTGENRLHAIFGTSPHCAATHASDLAVALLALDASVHVRRHDAAHTLPIAELFRLPGDTPQSDNALGPGELIVAVEVPVGTESRRSCYLKVRDRASFEFTVVSVAVALQIEGDVIRSARLAAGGVGTVPWRLAASEAALAGARAEPAAFAAAAAHAADGAQPLSQNGFKIELLRRAVRRALELAR
ncbi:MAG: xanthine dehydrogenase family protein subunit M [Rhizobiales bacterium]|nr:xanthine dehydrogenase family protein subunit M [Hyphomicrobiales bacterium]